MFAINAILYSGYFVICLVYLAVLFAEKPKFPRTVAVIAIFWAALVHMGTGAIFGFIAARPIFYSPLKPLEFLAAAMASGLALLIVLVATIFRFARRNFNVNILFSLGKLLLALIILLFVLVFIDKLTHLYSADREPTLWLLTGHYAWIFWGLQVGFAYVLPMILLGHPRSNKTLKGVIGAALLVVIGIFGERFVLVIPGAAYPLPFYPGTIEGIWGALGHFPFTLAETLISLGIFGLMGLFLVLGLKHLELLPVYEGSEQGSPSPEIDSEAHDGKAL